MSAVWWRGEEWKHAEVEHRTRQKHLKGLLPDLKRTPAWNRFLLPEGKAHCSSTRHHGVVFSASQVEYSAGLVEVEDGLRSKVKVTLTCAVQMHFHEKVSYTLALCSALFSGQRCNAAGPFILVLTAQRVWLLYLCQNRVVLINDPDQSQPKSHDSLLLKSNSERKLQYW